MKNTDYEKLCVTVMIYIYIYKTANGNKLPPYLVLNKNTVTKENVCKDVINSSGPKKCMDGI
jgi:hypothetical protein